MAGKQKILPGSFCLVPASSVLTSKKTLQTLRKQHSQHDERRTDPVIQHRQHRQKAVHAALQICADGRIRSKINAQHQGHQPQSRNFRQFFHKIRFCIHQVAENIAQQKSRVVGTQQRQQQNRIHAVSVFPLATDRRQSIHQQSTQEQIFHRPEHPVEIIMSKQETTKQRFPQSMAVARLEIVEARKPVCGTSQRRRLGVLIKPGFHKGKNDRAHQKDRPSQPKIPFCRTFCQPFPVMILKIADTEHKPAGHKKQLHRKIAVVKNVEGRFTDGHLHISRRVAVGRIQGIECKVERICKVAQVHNQRSCAFQPVNIG